jgi:hypothetical protein
MSKYSLFGVNIHPETTYNKINTLKVSSKKEIFYDIFECSFKGEKIIVEKIGEFENKPIVEFKLNKDGKVSNCQAFLEIGKEDNLFLYEKVKKPIKNLKVINEQTKKIVNKKVNKKAFEDKKRKIQEKESQIIDSMAEEAIKLLEEKQKLDQKQKLEEAKKLEEKRKLEEAILVKEAKKLLEEKVLKEKLDADIKKMNEQVKIVEEQEKIEQEKIRLQEEAKKLEEIKLLEEKRKLKEELIRNTPFYDNGSSYALDIDTKYKNIKITNENTGAVKIFESKGVPRKVVLNENLLSYHNIINEETNLNYTIDIETEEIVNEKYIEPDDMGGSAYAKKKGFSQLADIVDSNTIINVLFDDSGSMNTTLGPLQTMVSTGTLRSTLLPFFDDDESVFDAQVNVRLMSDISGPTDLPGPAGGFIQRVENSIALGGLDMTSASNNVINLMFQDESDNRTLSDFNEENNGSSGTYTGSVNFLKNRLDVLDNNIAIFFQVPNVTPQGPIWKQTLQDLQTSLAGTRFESQTDFNFDVAAAASPSFYADLILESLNKITS